MPKNLFDKKTNINLSIDAYKSNDYNKPYERYHHLHEQMKSVLEKIPKAEILDIGCGDASFIYYLKKKYPNAKFTGIEINQELIDKIKKEPFLQDIKIIKNDVQDFNLNKQFDIVIIAGVLSIFDDFELILQNILKHIKSKGYGYIFGCFNSEDIDVIIRYRNNFCNSKIWESGLNLFSLKTVQRALEPYVEDIKINRFELKIKLEKKPDPIRTFTIEKKDGSNLIADGANIINDFYTISFMKK